MLMGKLLTGKPNITLVRLGLRLELLKMKLLPQRDLLTSMKLFQRAGFKSTLDAFKNTDKYIWTNIFFPSELIFAFDLYPLCMETVSNVISRMKLEHIYIEESSKMEIVPSLCSFHRTYLGIVSKEILPPPVCVASVSNSCEGSLLGFRIAAKKVKRPFLYIDVPYKLTKEAIKYVSHQIKELIGKLEELTGQKFDIDRFRKVLGVANKTREYIIKINELRKKHTLNVSSKYMLGLLIASHVLYGSDYSYHFYRTLYQDLKDESNHMEENPNLIRLLWLHLGTAYTNDFMHLIDNGIDTKIVFEELNYMYWDEFDLSNPIESLAIKLINNWINGEGRNRIDIIERLARDYRVDGVINFSQWGCRQIGGSLGMLQKRFDKIGIPLLNLDGDLVDRQNCTSGQFKTRIQGFLEMIDKNR